MFHRQPPAIGLTTCSHDPHHRALALTGIHRERLAHRLCLSVGPSVPAVLSLDPPAAGEGRTAGAGFHPLATRTAALPVSTRHRPADDPSLDRHVWYSNGDGACSGSGTGL